jgi:predicted nucleic acid-binding protein
LPKKTYIQLGEELAAHDRQGSFFAFAEKLGVSRTAGYRLIRSAEVARQIEKVGLPVPQRESQARILHENLDDPAQRIAAWKAAIEEGKSRRLTAAVVRASVAKVLEQKKAEGLAATERERAKKEAEYAALNVLGRLEVQMKKIIERERNPAVRAEKQKDWEEIKARIASGEMNQEDASDYLDRAKRLNNLAGLAFNKRPKRNLD